MLRNAERANDLMNSPFKTGFVIFISVQSYLFQLPKTSQSLKEHCKVNVGQLVNS